MDWRFLEYQVADPAWNMAVDEAIFLSYLQGDAPPTLRCYGWNPATLSVGYFQDLDQEVNLGALQSAGYGLVRRTTGGRAVLHDRELTYSVVAGARDGLPDNLRESYLYIAKALVEALKQFGIQPELHQGGVARHAQTGACFEAPSWYELTLAGRKLVGSAQYRKAGCFMQHGSILLEFSAGDLFRLLKMTDSFEQFQIAMRQRVTCLGEQGVVVNPGDLAGKLVTAFAGLYGMTIRTGQLSRPELELARQLAAEKYANETWTLRRGHSRSERVTSR